MLTDSYQLTMAYGYWQANRHLDPAVFDLFFRENPFKGKYCIFAGTFKIGYVSENDLFLC